MPLIAVYPGTFDPITNGHIDVARRAACLFDRVILAIAENVDKKPFFSIEARTALAREALAEYHNIEVHSFNGLLVECAREWDARVIVRGLRAVSDFEYEVQLAGLNRKMAPDLVTVFISAAQEHAFLSSSMVREIARLGGNVSEFVHPSVQKALGNGRNQG